MNIDIKLNKNFSNQFNRLLEEYGVEFAHLNGFSDEQMSYTDFIDNFVDTKVVADASIDGNANVGHKDIVSLENEMSKPHSKLLAFNKIFYELNKKYGFQTAKKWLESEWTGKFYLHDAYNSSFKSYCILPQECCVFILNGKKIHSSLNDIYELITEPEEYDKKQEVWYKRPKNLLVYDYDILNKKERYTKVVCISKKVPQSDLRFIKACNGANLITTKDHIFITPQGEIKAQDLNERNFDLYTSFDNSLFTNSIDEYEGLTLSYELGYIVGMYLAEGYVTRGQITICQNQQKSPQEYSRIIKYLNQIGIPYKEYKIKTNDGEVNGLIRLRNGENNWERKILKIAQGKLCENKHLCPDYVHFNTEFLFGVLAGIIDGDGTIANNKMVMIRMTSRTLINQIREIGLSQGVYFGSRIPYIQSQNARIAQKRPMHSANVNMNRNKEFFLKLNSLKINNGFTDYAYNENMANKNYICQFGCVPVRDAVDTYNSSGFVFDLSTESHTFICNDILIHNCFAYDIQPLVEKGLFFIEGFNAQPPKHLTTFVDFVGEFVSWTCNRTSGAVGLPSFLVYSYYFWKKDCEQMFVIKDPEYYRDQSFQEIIYRLNQPFLRGGIQSAFTNFSIFDRPYLESIFGGKTFPDGSFMIDEIDNIIEYEKAFMRVLSKVRSENMMTFPVMTYALLRKDGKFVDEEFAKWCCKHNMKWADSNFFISEDVTSLSNCCFDGNQMTLTKSSSGVNYRSFKELYDSPYSDSKRNFTVFHNGSWVKGKLIKLPKTPLLKITTANNKELLLTKNHIQPTLEGDKRADALTINDYLLFNTRELNSFPERNQNLTYEQGYLIGMYLGDGSKSNKDLNNGIYFSLNEEKYEKGFPLLNGVLEQMDIEDKFKLGRIKNNSYPVYIYSAELKNFILNWVSGSCCFDKRLNLNCLLQSIEFRKGILRGLYDTDGGNSNRIYTTSSGLASDIEVLLTSLGKNSVIDISRRMEEPVIIRNEQYNRNYPLYCVRWYENTNKRSFGEVYKVVNNSTYFKIKSIEEYDSKEDYVYCFEMQNENEPYFTLPNGVITHNCRLLSDVKNLGYFNSIGGTALEVGSVKVNTINLARIAYETNTTKSYLAQLRERAVLCLQTLDVIRNIIKRNAEKGLLPNYSLKIINLSSQYNTIGIIGIYEALQKFGFVKEDELGYHYYTDEGIEFAKNIFAVLNEEKAKFTQDKDYMVNIEQIPGESAASILMQKDKALFPDQIYELPLYANQWIPLGVKCTLKEKIRVSAILDKACSGGSIAHINLEAPLENFDTAWNLLNYIADEGVQYFAFCTRISACENNHGYYGDICPHCGKPTVTTYQRIVGFLTPEKTYSKARKEEFGKRTWFKTTGKVYED